MADGVGAEATILAEASLAIGGYGDLGTRTVSVSVTRRSLRALAKHLAAWQRSREETVRLLVEIEEANGTRHKEALTFKAGPWQSTVTAADNALRGLPGISEALDRSLW
ncbi:MAG: hypothetical protein ACXVUE_09175 [Solirubrobacteraceae bacterium]